MVNRAKGIGRLKKGCKLWISCYRVLWKSFSDLADFQSETHLRYIIRVLINCSLLVNEMPSILLVVCSDRNDRVIRNVFAERNTFICS